MKTAVVGPRAQGTSSSSHEAPATEGCTSPATHPRMKETVDFNQLLHESNMSEREWSGSPHSESRHGHDSMKWTHRASNHGMRPSRLTTHRRPRVAVLGGSTLVLTEAFLPGTSGVVELIVMA